MTKAKMIGLLLLTATTAGSLFATAASAEELATFRPGDRDRGQKWEFTLPITFTESETFNTEGGSSVDINSDFAFGFGLGYNFNEHFQLNGAISWSYRSYDALVVLEDQTTARYSNYLDSSTISMNGIYFFSANEITPFVSAGIGSTYIDTNIQDGPGSSSCWWDPWWGYMCSTYVPTKSGTEFSYNAGVGMRFDINRQFAMQVSYNQMWIDFSNASGTPGFDNWKVDFVFRM